MLAGIYLDTKGFSTRTGVRTFEAAAYLRRAGAESVSYTHLDVYKRQAYRASTPFSALIAVGVGGMLLLSLIHI